MLILSRKQGESFFLGEDIEIVILDVQNDKIKIGINAPQSVKVIRRELREIEKANLDAASSEGISASDVLKSGVFNKKIK